MRRKWKTIMDDTDFTEMREISPRVFQFINVIDMDDACGSDNEGRPTYVAELMLVDLNQISPATLASAIESCGWEGAGSSPDALAEICRSYGAHAPLGSWEGNGREVVRRQARSEAHMLLHDQDAMTERMERPVNALGSTATEYMKGDLDSALTRGVQEGRHDARILAKMYGADQLTIDAVSDERPSDWLPWFMGYMAGSADAYPKATLDVFRHLRTGDDFAPEYLQGYRRGELVRKGEAVAPSWIK